MIRFDRKRSTIPIVPMFVPFSMNLRILFPFLLLMTTSPSIAGPLDPYRWAHRLVVLDFPSSAAESLSDVERQIRRTRAEIEDRDLLFFHVGELGRRGKTYATKLSDDEVRQVRRRLGLGESTSGPSLVLIGKDGGVKARQKRDFKLAEFYRLIDTMPMRQREMRERD